MSVIRDPELESLLAGLHARSGRQRRCEAYLAFLDAHGFRTMTLPFDGGLEMSVLCRH